ncbi:protein kish-A-like [Echinops telfairi]|uniref:Protein kish-A-like n=1 Tax=Echinops telfairi TaxID=9371 RepID=A0AC55DPD3_ECHTE|nr:protein kish-A-like [Echinops telfairi]
MKPGSSPHGRIEVRLRSQVAVQAVLTHANPTCAVCRQSCSVGLPSLQATFWDKINGPAFCGASGIPRLTVSAVFNVYGLLTVILLCLCTCAYIPSLTLNVLDRNKTGLWGVFRKCATTGVRKSPHVAVCCRVMPFSLLFTQ